MRHLLKIIDCKNKIDLRLLILLLILTVIWKNQFLSAKNLWRLFRHILINHHYFINLLIQNRIGRTNLFLRLDKTSLHHQVESLMVLLENQLIFLMNHHHKQRIIKRNNKVDRITQILIILIQTYHTLNQLLDWNFTREANLLLEVVEHLLVVTFT